MKAQTRAQLPVLLVDDETEVLKSHAFLLEAAGISNLILCSRPAEVAGLALKQELGVVLLDLRMPELSGETVLASLVEAHPEIPVIVLTGAQDIETAVRCMRLGATDYMVKPVEENRFVFGVLRALELRDLRRENDLLGRRVLGGAGAPSAAFAGIVTNHPAMHAIFSYLEAVAGSARPVLVTGETGVGKELIARGVHELSGRRGEFVALNAAGLDDALFADTLFGHARGAFTGAGHARAGLVERAQGGTLFLDEIGDLAPNSQVKLLRFLQSREYFPLGSDVPRLADVRIVAASNRPLESLTQDNTFRRDLFYRLQTHHVHVPPLRERREDLPLLTGHFLDEAARSLGKTKPTAPRELYTLLAAHAFPGNIRELESMVHDAVSRHQRGVLSLDVFRARVAPGLAPAPSEEPAEATAVFSRLERLPSMNETARLLMHEAMRRARGNQTLAARLLGLSQSALSRRLRRNDSD